MLDNLEKTYRLLDILEEAVPFDVTLGPGFAETLRKDADPLTLATTHSVTQVEYLGDEGGIMCILEPQQSDGAIVISLTHLRVSRRLPFAPFVIEYQRHRVKRMKKAGYF